MAQVVLLSDITSYGELETPRYIGPYVLANQLEAHGFSTTVIDYFTKKPDLFSYLSSFLTEETLIVGISTTFLTPFQSYFETSRNRFEGTTSYRSGFLWFEDGNEWLQWSHELKSLVRAKSPKARILVGGAKTTSFFNEPQMGRDIDFLVLAAADASIVRCAQSLFAGQEPQFFTGQSGLKYLSHIVLKNQTDICPQTLYKPRVAIEPRESLPIEISRGCIFNCKFCYYEKRKSVRKDVRSITEEIRILHEEHGTTVFYFSDDCFNDSRKKVEEVCTALIQLPFKIEWVSYARFDVAVRFPHTVDLMIESGASALFWGVESLDREAARRAGKGTPPEEVMKFLIDFKKRWGDRCFSYGSFITGLPGEDESSFLKNLDWVLKEDCLHSSSFGPLTLSGYNEKLDMNLIDYADYSRNPEKYGFKMVSDDLKNWEHETMTFAKACELAELANGRWLNEKGAGLFSTTWQYPQFRTLGFTKEQIFSSFLSNERKFDLAAEVTQRNSEFMRRYWDKLALRNQNRVTI